MKKRIVTFLVLLSLVFCITGCSHENISIDRSDIMKDSPFSEIPGEDYLVYHLKTGTIYVVYFYTDGIVSRDYSISAPYIQNGHFCEYRDGKIVEINN